MNCNCKTCRHHQGKPQGDRRECRALPPQFAAEKHLGAGQEYGFFAIWPLTRLGDGCGAHEPPPPEPVNFGVLALSINAVTTDNPSPPAEAKPEVGAEPQPESEARRTKKKDRS